MEREALAEYKSEYFLGEIFAMSGASHNHNLISMNIAASLHGTQMGVAEILEGLVIRTDQ